MRRPSFPPISGPTNEPTIAPHADAICAFAFAAGAVPPVIWSTHNATHWIDPHVPMSATDAKRIPRQVYLSRGGRNTSRSGFVFGFATAFHFSDSGTNNRIKNTRIAGTAPIKNIPRQFNSVTLHSFAT